MAGPGEYLPGRGPRPWLRVCEDVSFVSFRDMDVPFCDAGGTHGVCGPQDASLLPRCPSLSKVGHLLALKQCEV